MTEKEEKSKGSNSQHTVKLPKLTIKSFDGDVLEWNSFMDSFTSAVDKSSLKALFPFNARAGVRARNFLK